MEYKFRQAKILFFGSVLIGFFSLALSGNSKPTIIQGNIKEHGWDGPLRIDPKTGLLHPPPSKFTLDMEKVAVWGPHSDKYCKYLEAGSVFHTRYYKNLCSKMENGEKIDLCCTGYECTRYGMGGGYWCSKIRTDR